MMDMIVNQAAKLRYMLGGTPTVPVVFRGPQGGGIRTRRTALAIARGLVRSCAGADRGSAIDAL